MFECSIYGLTRRKLEWKGEKFKRIERVYAKNSKSAIINSDVDSSHEKSSSVSTIIIKETPDRNKQRTSVVSKLTKLKILNKSENEDKLLCTLGFKYVHTNVLEGFRYLRNGYQIEITKIVKKEEIVDSSEEENLDSESKEISSSFCKYFLVKVFVETENVHEGEKLLEDAFHELIGQIKLVKPDLFVF